MDSAKRTFNESYELYSKDLYRFIFYKIDDSELAKDFTAEVFVRFWKVLKKGEEVHNCRALLYKMAHGIVIDYYRSKKNKKTIPLESVNEIDLVSNEDIEGKISIKQQSEEVLEALKGLKQEYQDILLLYYVDELTVPEIAQAVAKKENAVRVSIHRGIKALQEAYAARKHN